MADGRRMLLCALGALGCAPVGTLGKDLPDESSTGAPHADSGDDSSTGTLDTTSGSTSATDSSSGEHGSTSGTTTHHVTTDETTAGEDVCAPSIDDTECTSCTKTACCEEITACAADPVCTCIHECHAAGTPIDMCMMRCGDDGGANEARDLCVHDSCTPPCP
jgi:hypothetical protein